MRLWAAAAAMACFAAAHGSLPRLGLAWDVVLTGQTEPSLSLPPEWTADPGAELRGEVRIARVGDLRTVETVWSEFRPPTGEPQKIAHTVQDSASSQDHLSLAENFKAPTRSAAAAKSQALNGPPASSFPQTLGMRLALPLLFGDPVGGNVLFQPERVILEQFLRMPWGQVFIQRSPAGFAEEIVEREDGEVRVRILIEGWRLIETGESIPEKMTITSLSVEGQEAGQRVLQLKGVLEPEEVTALTLRAPKPAQADEPEMAAPAPAPAWPWAAGGAVVAVGGVWAALRMRRRQAP
jgi:hypothetical protein